MLRGGAYWEIWQGHRNGLNLETVSGTGDGKSICLRRKSLKKQESETERSGNRYEDSKSTG